MFTNIAFVIQICQRQKQNTLCFHSILKWWHEAMVGTDQRYHACFCFVSRIRKSETKMASCQSSSTSPVSRERLIQTGATPLARNKQECEGSLGTKMEVGRRIQQDSNETFELAQLFMNKQFISYLCMAFCWIPTRALIYACSSLFLFLCRFVH